MGAAERRRDTAPEAKEATMHLALPRSTEVPAQELKLRVAIGASGLSLVLLAGALAALLGGAAA